VEVARDGRRPADEFRGNGSGVDPSGQFINLEVNELLADLDD
jgi:hypothetical protein